MSKFAIGARYSLAVITGYIVLWVFIEGMNRTYALVIPDYQTLRQGPVAYFIISLAVEIGAYLISGWSCAMISRRARMPVWILIGFGEVGFSAVAYGLWQSHPPDIAVLDDWELLLAYLTLGFWPVAAWTGAKMRLSVSRMATVVVAASALLAIAFYVFAYPQFVDHTSRQPERPTATPTEVASRESYLTQAAFEEVKQAILTASQNHGSKSVTDFLSSPEFRSLTNSARDAFITTAYPLYFANSRLPRPARYERGTPIAQAESAIAFSLIAFKAHDLVLVQDAAARDPKAATGLVATLVAAMADLETRTLIDLATAHSVAPNAVLGLPDAEAKALSVRGLKGVKEALRRQGIAGESVDTVIMQLIAVQGDPPEDDDWAIVVRQGVRNNAPHVR